MADDEAIRLTMTFPGSASLGAYQAGVASALAIGINALRSEGVTIHLDAVGGSSAGSIVGVLLTHCLHTGRDAAGMLRRAWIEEVDMDLLRNGGVESPLTFNQLKQKLDDFITDEDEHPRSVNEPLTEPTTVQVAVTSLLGFEQPLQSAGGEMSSLSYADWIEFTLEPEHDFGAMLEGDPVSIVDAVLASASHPLGFRPVALDRSNTVEDHAAEGITNLPDDNRLWYTDGGLVESRPVGRVIEAARKHRSGPGRRVHIVVDPRTSGPSQEWDVTGEGEEKSWMDGLRRSISVVPTQALHDDLRNMARVNERLRRLDETARSLADRFDTDVDELRGELADMAGLEGKVEVLVEMISPLLMAAPSRGHGDHGSAETEPTDLLAGDFIGAFGGFLDQTIRISDFALGWRCATEWFPDALERAGVDEAVIERVVEQVEQGAEDKTDIDIDREVKEGDGVDQLDWQGRWRLTVLAGQFARVALNQAVPIDISPSDLVTRLTDTLLTEDE